METEFGFLLSLGTPLCHPLCFLEPRSRVFPTFGIRLRKEAIFHKTCLLSFPFPRFPSSSAGRPRESLRQRLRDSFPSRPIQSHSPPVLPARQCNVSFIDFVATRRNYSGFANLYSRKVRPALPAIL